MLAILLALSELVRLGRLLSLQALVWTGHIARFSGLGWAGTALIVLVFARIISGSGSASIESTALPILFWSSGVIALFVSFYSFSVGRTRIATRKYRIGDPGEHPALRITTLSDLHIGEYVTAEHIRKAVEISNELSPDIVLLLGDYVDQDGALAGDLINELTRLEAKLGVFAILGNHDIAASKPQKIVDSFEHDTTVNLLRNASALIQIESPGPLGTDAYNSVLQIIGIESPGDWWEEDANELIGLVIQKEISDQEADFTLVASHHPDIFDLGVSHNIDMIVAGHTHGGQLAVPYTGRWLNIGRLATKYLWGRYERGGTSMIVTAGIGVGVIPARLGVPPEVTLIEFGPEQFGKNQKS
jgi:hypothetical protein